jgi:hypothetical protein
MAKAKEAVKTPKTAKGSSVNAQLKQLALAVDTELREDGEIAAHTREWLATLTSEIRESQTKGLPLPDKIAKCEDARNAIYAGVTAGTTGFPFSAEVQAELDALSAKIIRYKAQLAKADAVDEAPEAETETETQD